MNKVALMFDALPVKTKEERRNNKIFCTNHLIAEGVNFKESRNGAFLTIKEGWLVIRFWPSTGTWFNVEYPLFDKGTSLKQLMSRLEENVATQEMWKEIQERNAANYQQHIKG